MEGSICKSLIGPCCCYIPSLNESLEDFCCLSSLFLLLCVRYNPEADNWVGVR